MTEPTERPIYTASGEVIYGETPEDGIIAKVYGDPELAGLFVERFNLHDELVAACKGLVELPEVHTMEQAVEVYERCQAVLAKAQLEGGKAGKPLDSKAK